METLQLLGVALGLATLAGINLYLTVCLTGLAIRFEWITLLPQYQQLEILAHPAIITVAGVLYLIEFFADKVPWLDSAWDSIHTIIRPVGGTLLAIQALGEASPVFDVLVAMLACGLSLTTHSLKAGTRILVNGSPEPVSNVVLSVVEDAAVVGGLWLLYLNPVVAICVLLLALGVAWYFVPRMFRAVKFRLWLIWRKLQTPARTHDASAKLPDRLPSDADILFHTVCPGGGAVEWAVPCATGRGCGVPPYTRGYLIATASDPGFLYFVAPGKFRKTSRAIDLRGYKVTQEPRFLSENLVLYGVQGEQKFIFLFDRPRAQLVEQIAASISARLDAARPIMESPRAKELVAGPAA